MATTPPLADLLTTINAALNNLPPSLTLQSAGADVFEAYVLSLILDAATIEGATIDFLGRNATVPDEFIFRTSPGHLYSSNQNYTYARLTFPNLPSLEAHTGVYVSGKSQLIHEADVVVLTAAEGILSRQNSVPPRSSQCLVTLECKFYASNISLALGRGFVGLCSDFSSRENFFATNSGSISVEKLLTHKRIKWASQLRPDQVVVVERFRNEIQSVFKDYVAKHS